LDNLALEIPISTESIQDLLARDIRVLCVDDVSERLAHDLIGRPAV
jgi:hypothetical protein